MNEEKEEIIPWLNIGGLYQVEISNGIHMTKTVESGSVAEHVVVWTWPGDIVMVTEFVTRTWIPRKEAGKPRQTYLAEWYRGLFTPRHRDSTLHVTFRYDQYSHLVPVTPESLIRPGVSR